MTPKNFFRATQSHSLYMLKHSFSMSPEWYLLVLASGQVWILKNDHQLTFDPIKTCLSIVRPRRWLVCMPTDLNKCLTTYFDVLSALENFLSALEQSLFISKFSFLNKFWQNFASGELLRPWNPKNHQVVTFSLLKTVSNVVWCRRLLLRVATDLN